MSDSFQILSVTSKLHFTPKQVHFAKHKEVFCVCMCVFVCLFVCARACVALRDAL